MKTIAVRLMLVAALAVPGLGEAQRASRDTVRIAPMVVTATRSALATERAPASVTVLQGAQLRAEGITQVVDALRQVPGISLASTGSYGGASSLFIRGGESKFTKVLIDGVPVNDAGGAFDFSSLSMDNIERIEIVRGPASVLYGSDAVAGVVQLFTRRGSAGMHGELAVRGGELGTRDYDAALRGAESGVDYSLAGARHDTRGFQAFNSDVNEQVASALAGYTGSAGDAHLSLRYRDSKFHYPTDGSGLVTDSNAVRREDRLALGLDGGYRILPRAELRVALAAHAVHGVSDDQPDSPGDNSGYFTSFDKSWRRSADVRVNLELPRATRLTVGGTLEGQWQETASASNFGDTPADSQYRRTSGAYAQLLLAPTEQVTLTVGGRYDHSDRFGEFGTWRAAGSVAPRAGTRLRASVGTAFREPTFIENFGCCGGFVRGNPDLSPERGLSFDAGVEQDVLGMATLGATVFDNSFRNLIDYTSAASGPNYVNVARTRTRGLELETRATLPAGIHADASFTYLDARVAEPGKGTGVTAQFATGARLVRRPMHTLDAGVGYRKTWLGADLRALRVGTREDNYFAPDFSTLHVTLPAYTRVDLSGEATLVEGGAGRGTVVATLRAENLFDAQYTEAAGFNFDGRQGDMSNTGYRGAPRRVLAGVRLSF